MARCCAASNSRHVHVFRRKSSSNSSFCCCRDEKSEDDESDDAELLACTFDVHLTANTAVCSCIPILHVCETAEMQNALIYLTPHFWKLVHASE